MKESALAKRRAARAQRSEALENRPAVAAGFALGEQRAARGHRRDLLLEAGLLLAAAARDFSDGRVASGRPGVRGGGRVRVGLLLLLLRPARMLVEEAAYGGAGGLARRRLARARGRVGERGTRLTGALGGPEMAAAEREQQRAAHREVLHTARLTRLACAHSRRRQMI